MCIPQIVHNGKCNNCIVLELIVVQFGIKLLLLLPTFNQCFDFTPVTEATILDHLTNMSSDSKLDVLDMDSRLLKISCSVITPSLTSIFNQSLNKGTITEPWKTARISPIYKGKGPTDDLGNYRPISVLSQVSKIIEKCVHDQLMSYLRCNTIITKDKDKRIKSILLETTNSWIVYK